MFFMIGKGFGKEIFERLDIGRCVIAVGLLKPGILLVRKIFVSLNPLLS